MTIGAWLGAVAIVGGFGLYSLLKR